MSHHGKRKRVTAGRVLLLPHRRRRRRGEGRRAPRGRGVDLAEDVARDVPPGVGVRGVRVFTGGRGERRRAVARGVRLVAAASGAPSREVRRGERVERVPAVAVDAVFAAGQGDSGGERLRGEDDGPPVRGAAAVRPARLVRRVELRDAAAVRAVSRVGPHERAFEVRGGHGEGGRHKRHLHGPRAGPESRGAHRRGDGRRQVGSAAELPPGALVDAQFGKDLRGHHGGLGGRELPVVAHLHALARVPGDHPAKRHQDDQRAAARVASEHAPLVPARTHRQPRLFRELRQAGDV